MEVTIERAKNNPQRFARCNNTECRNIFLVDPADILGESGFLCPKCKSKLESHHFVQCSYCQSIVNFIPAEPSEEPIVFNVEKCCNCKGTVEDEIRVTPQYYPDAYF